MHIKKCARTVFMSVEFSSVSFFEFFKFTDKSYANNLNPKSLSGNKNNIEIIKGIPVSYTHLTLPTIYSV